MYFLHIISHAPRLNRRSPGIASINHSFMYTPGGVGLKKPRVFRLLRRLTPDMKWPVTYLWKLTVELSMDIFVACLYSDVNRRSATRCQRSLSTVLILTLSSAKTTPLIVKQMLKYYRASDEKSQLHALTYMEQGCHSADSSVKLSRQP